MKDHLMNCEYANGLQGIVGSRAESEEQAIRYALSVRAEDGTKVRRVLTINGRDVERRQLDPDEAEYSIAGETHIERIPPENFAD